MTTKPNPGDFPTFSKGYIDIASNDDTPANLLWSNKKEVINFFSNWPEDRWEYRYADGKWNLKESFLHLIDTERIMAYRALRIARGDTSPLAGFNQDDYIPYSNATERSVATLIEEFATVRNASITLFNNLAKDSLDRAGISSGARMTVRSLLFIILGHAKHHILVADKHYR